MTEILTSEYEAMNHQQCPKGIHTDWLVDSEYSHACPWCQIDALDKLSDEVIAERDGMHDALDNFAWAVAPGEVIGEHSSGNNPWANALELVTPAAEVDALRERLAALQAAVVETAFEYAVSVPGREGVISASGRAEAVETAAHIQQRRPGSHVVRRSISYGAWTEAT
jgi:hypothetical protein